MALKQIRDSLPWLVPSAAIVLAASGALPSLNLFGSDEPQPQAVQAPVAVPVAPVSAPANALAPAYNAQVQPAPATPPALVAQDNVVARQANPATSLTPSDPLIQPVAPVQTQTALIERVPTPVQPQVLQDTQADRERRASLKPDASFAPSFAAPAVSNQCVDDLRNLAAQARVYFPSGGFAADAGGIEQGRLIGLIAQTCPGVQIVVEGHSDPSGDPAANLRLSKQRASAVIQRIAAAGIDTSNFIAQGFGDQQPSGIVGTQPSWYYDRRVQFSVVAKDQALPAARPTTLATAQPWAGAACVKELERAVGQTALFYSPGSVSLQQSDLEAAMRLAEMAIQCPHARLRVIGHHSADPLARENVQTGILRAKALMAMMVGRGAQPEEIIIAAPSIARGGAADNGMPGSRVNFDIILEDG